MSSSNQGRKKLTWVISIILLLLVTSGNVYPNNQLKESFFHNYTTDHGLPHPLCQCIEEDTNGYIWVGTPGGLLRYDGVYFELFNENNSALNESNITALHQNKESNILWVGTKNGSICAVNTTDNSFTRVNYHSRHINPAGIGSISHIYQYSDSILLIATNRNGLMRINLGNLSISYINQKGAGDFQHLQVNNIHPIDRTTYVVAKQGIYAIQPDETQGLKMVPFHVNQKNTTDLIQETDSSFLITAQNSLLRYHLPSKLIETIKTFDYPISRLIQLPSKKIWMATRNNGLILFDPLKNTTQYHTVGNSRYSLLDNNIYALLESSRNSILWIATKNGLSKLDNRHNDIKYFDLNQFSDSKSANLFMIKKDSHNNYWIWATDGLFRKMYNESHFSKITPTKDYSNKDSIYHCIETLKRGLLFASTRGVLHYTPENGQFKYLPLKNRQPYFHLANINSHTYCFLAINKFVIYDCRNQTEKVHTIENYNNIRLQNCIVDGDSLLWIGSNHGLLFKYHLANQQITDTIKIPANKNLSSLAAISATQMDDRRNLWIATQGAGLFKYNIDKNSFEKIKTSNDETESVYVLKKDLKGNMWLTNHLGIININSQTGQQKVFGYNHYILCQEYNMGASDLAADGTILLGGANGFNELTPNQIQTPSYNHKPIIASYVLLPNSAFSFDDRNQKTVYNPQDTIVISKEFESIRIHVRFLNFVNSKKGKIAWKIDQIDTSWQNSTVASPVIYSNIPPGKNKMTIVALDDNNNPTGAPLTIIIKKEVYFFRHPAFITAIIILAFFMVIVLFILRNKKLVKQRQKLNEMVAEKTAELVGANQALIQSKEKITLQNEELEIHRVYLEELVKIKTLDLEKAKQKAEESDQLKTAFLANLSHEIRTPMNCIMGFTTLLSSDLFTDQEKNEFVQHIQNSSESLLVLINDIIDISRIETRQIKLIQSNLNIESDLTQIVRSLKFEKTEAISEISINIDPSCKNQTLATDKERFKQIVQNLINNAIKFTANGQIELSAKIIEKQELKNYYYKGLTDGETTKLLLVSVADHGIGIAPENQQLIFEPFRKVENKEVLYPGIGLGLSIVKNLTELLNGEVWLKSEVGQGSTFYFFIPAQ